MAASEEGSRYRRTILEIEERMSIRANLSFQMAKFMLGMAEIIDSRQLRRVSHRYWGTAARTTIRDRVHKFEVEGADGLDLPEEAYIGELFVPSEVHIAFDTGIESDAINYELRGERTTADGIESGELLVTLTNPRDVIGATWQLVANPGEDEVTRPLDGVMSPENNRQFGGVSAALQASLAPAIFRRFS